MIKELIKKYKEELEMFLEQITINDKVDEIIAFLDNKSKFSNFDFSLYKNIFIKANYDEEEINKIENNIKYIKLFINSDDFIEYNDFINVLKEKFKKLNNLKKKVNNQEEIIEKINKLNNLQNNLENITNYIEDIDFIFEIFQHYNIEFKDIKVYIKEIIEHNKNVLENINQNTLIIGDDNSETIVEEESNFLNNIISNVNFSELEKGILKKYYDKNKEEFEEKYKYLKDIKELSYVFNNIEGNKKLFIILMTLSNIDIVNNVIGICNFRNIKLKKMLPNIFVSNNVKFNLDNLVVDDEFYSLFSGSNENFINNLNYINLGLDLSKIEPSYYITDTILIRNNHQILKKYGIDLSIDSIECLTITDLEDKLNKIIESGLYTYFKENPRKILEIKDKAFFYRLKYAKDTGETYKRKHLVKELFAYDGYKITEDNYLEKLNISTIPLFESSEYKSLDDVDISNGEIIIHPFIKMLDELYITENNMAYNIYNYIISREKVIKKFNQFLKMNVELDNNSLYIGFIYSILDGLILNKSEILGLNFRIMEKLIEYYPTELADISKEVIDDRLFKKSNSIGGK